MPDAQQVTARAWWADRALIARATRAKTVPLVVMPVLLGAAFASFRGHDISLGSLIVTMAGAAFLHLAANVINDYYDEKSGADGFARLDKGSIATGSGVVAAKKMTPRALMTLAVVLLAIALACGVALAFARGPAVLLLGALGALLAHQYVAPPLRYGYRGRGLGEVGIALAFGVMPVVGSFYVQTGRVEADVVWLSLVPALFTTLVLFHHHFLHWRADKHARKMTPVAVLGPDIAIVVSGIAIVAAYVLLTLEVAFDVLPGWALLALVTAPAMAGSWARVARDAIAQNSLNLLGVSLGTTVIVQLVLTIALLVS